MLCWRCSAGPSRSLGPPPAEAEQMLHPSLRSPPASTNQHLLPDGAAGSAAPPALELVCEPRVPMSQDQKWSFFIPPSLRRTDWKPSSLPTKPGQLGGFTSISPAVHTLTPLPSPAGHGGPVTPPVPQRGWDWSQHPVAGCAARLRDGLPQPLQRSASVLPK